MKNLKRYFSAVLSLAMVASVFTACNNDLEGYPDTILTPPSDKFNADIQFVSRLTDGKLATNDSDFDAINNYLVTTLEGKKKSWLTVLDRIDGHSQSKVLQIALNSKRWTAFVPNRISGADYQGSTLFFNEPTASLLSRASGDGSRVAGFAPKLSGVKVERDLDGNIKSSTSISFPAHFRTARFENADQISAFANKSGVLGKLYYDNMNFLMIGTVKNELLGSLQSASEGAGGYGLTLVKQGPAYSIFMLADKRFWAFTKVETVALSGGIESHVISVMW